MLAKFSDGNLPSSEGPPHNTSFTWHAAWQYVVAIMQENPTAKLPRCVFNPPPDRDYCCFSAHRYSLSNPTTYTAVASSPSSGQPLIKRVLAISKKNHPFSLFQIESSLRLLRHMQYCSPN